MRTVTITYLNSRLLKSLSLTSSTIGVIRGQPPDIVRFVIKSKVFMRTVTITYLNSRLLKSLSLTSSTKGGH